ncbi:SDR family NAD(P)-dependent oxidoreductase [Humitalea sp. 24SJ18S-53]|uniref:SDR family NAD(P)-dependent oxidoreductase n=1 Tax=Humitalea sp. 24SJ18S-53 TaxID=3422307 RepID=UPI003D6698A9
MDDKPMQGQVALVTGGVRRIGRATALALAAEGADVVLHARSSRAEADAVAREVEALGRRSMVVLCDVTDEDGVDSMMASIDAAFGRIDILVNNAAMRGEDPFLDMSFARWREITGTILDGAFLCARGALRRMVPRNYGRIINMGGFSAHVGAAERAHVVAAKAGVVGLTRALAVEFAGHGVTVNCVVPGKIGGKRSAGSGKGIAGMPIVGREGVPEDVAEVIRLLCRPASSFITGQSIHVNGGLFLN